MAATVFYPVPNRIYIRVFCILYECFWLHYLSILELTNYSCTKDLKAFYHNAFSFVAGLHNVGLLLIPISEQYYPVSKRVAWSEFGPHFLDNKWSRFTDGS